MFHLLSLPPNLVGCFHEITGLDPQHWFCSNDPIGRKLGSGGGTIHLLNAFEQSKSQNSNLKPQTSKRIIIHAGGQSRRLPAYAPSGKILTPIPVFRWERGQRLSQTLLDIPMPLYEQIMQAAPDSLRTMIVSGDVFIRSTESLQPVPEVDVVCYGLWLGPEIAKDHGIFVSDRRYPYRLKRMMQKPSVETLGELLKDHFYLTDIGIWLLSDRALALLRQKSTRAGEVVNYDLYSDFGRALGDDPEISDPDLASLKVAILPLPGGEFYHFGTTHEIISSILAVQNLVNDQRRIIHRSRKPHPSMFIQNSEMWLKPTGDNQYLWIENCCISEQWSLADHHVITGVPENAWKIELRSGQCIDIVPIGESQYVVRPYGYDDRFRGAVNDPQTLFIGQSFVKWVEERRISLDEVEGGDDLQSARIFPVVDNVHDAGLVLRWMLNEPEQDGGRMLWRMSRRMSADEISAEANLMRLEAQRCENRAKAWPFIAKNYRHSVFYQLDLENAAQEFAANNIAVPSPLSEDDPLLTRIHDAMFRSELLRAKEKNELAAEESGRAFELLRKGLTTVALADKQSPRMSVYDDQIVWGRSPVRIDIAGGWTDTPPYCLMEGGTVINLAIEINGQQPIQAYVKPCREYHIILRSIDLGAVETITTYAQLADFHHVGSPFSIPKAALVLAGFQPDFSVERYDSLEDQLRAFGCGIEVTLLSAIPAGSGLGTSSILAATVLGALNDFCGLMWDKNEIGHRTLVLEQLLTTGGGWQDQFGGSLQGVKLLQTQRGFDQNPVVRWLPDELFTQPDYRACHLLYYTGITRTAKTILAEIVRRMFLNQHDELALLREMKSHTMEMYEAIQRNDFNAMGRLVRRTWTQNQALDSGTNPTEVERLTTLIDDLCLGYKLPGAGGGGYLYMIAKDSQAAARVRQILSADPHRNPNARFVDMALSVSGLQISRS
ncbi:MAG: bifunctional fucokinase/L-fucose-1-P-guanylyltransferase [Prevotella sp.]|nr:bifunctional fucokinase/L-fucose-1-P-guanylyltransferase [Prevotella sp.]